MARPFLRHDIKGGFALQKKTILFSAGAFRTTRNKNFAMENIANMQANENLETAAHTQHVSPAGAAEPLKRSAENLEQNSVLPRKIRKLDDGPDDHVDDNTLQRSSTEGTTLNLNELDDSATGHTDTLQSDSSSQDRRDTDHVGLIDVDGNSESAGNPQPSGVQDEANSVVPQELPTATSQADIGTTMLSNIRQESSHAGPLIDTLNLRREGPASSIRSSDLASDISVPLDTPGPTPPPPSQLRASWVPQEIFDPSVYDRTETSATDSSDESDAVPVMREDLKDPALRHTYQNLPHLRFAELITIRHSGDSGATYSDVDLPGFYAMKNWEELFPTKLLILDRIKAAVTFSTNTIYFNPSRAHPNYVVVKPIGDNRYIVNPANHRSCLIAVTTGCCLSCNLVQGKTKQNRAGTSMQITKTIEIVPHTQEFERLVAFFGMVFDFESIKAACYSGHVLTFSTRTEANEKQMSESTSKFRAYLATNLAVRSDDKKPTARNEVKAFIKTSLGASDHVPIYDARKRDFRLHRDAGDITHLPLYKDGHEELPSGASVSVGYTVGVFKDKRDKTQELLTLNVRWVVLWAIPSLRHVMAE